MTDLADVYVTGLRVDEIFADPTYQRILDVARARRMSAEWDRRLAGILEVSDRGEDAAPRYAVIDGQHRWAAARYLQVPPPLVANVHTGLTVSDEAALFDKLNRQRKQTGTWDHWKARRAAGDELVLAVERTVESLGLRVSEAAGTDGTVSCIGTLEKIANCAGGLDLLASTLRIITAAWGTTQRSAFEAPLIHGVAMTLATLADRLDAQRLIDALGEQSPKRVRVQATTMRDSGIPGSLAKLSAVAIVNVYNGTAGRRLAWPNDWKGTLPKPARVTVTSTAQAKSRAGGRTELSGIRRSNLNAPVLDEIAGDHSRPRTVPDAIPHYAGTPEQADAVAEMQGKPVSEIAVALGIPERTVRRIQADLGFGAT
jgi:hypothetical protein